MYFIKCLYLERVALLEKPIFNDTLLKTYERTHTHTHIHTSCDIDRSYMKAHVI